jgi:GNAT superfamily N-acetyltransferase
VALMLLYEEETFSTCIDEARPLLEFHWQELARNRDRMRLDPRYETYLAAEKRNRLCIGTVRNDGVLIGYACYVVENNLHYGGFSWAVSDIFWLHPEWRGRGLGDRLFRFMEDRLRRRGAAVMHTTYKIEHPAAGRTLERLGHKQIEIGCSKLLLE